MARSVGLNAAHRHHFFKSGHLSLDEILTAEQCQSLARELLRAWSERIGKKGDLTCAQARQKGRDLWRDSRMWASKLLRSPIGNLALQLWSRTSLRLLYDQLLFLLPSANEIDRYSSFSLAAASAFGGIEGGLFICLQSPKRDHWQVSFEVTEQESVDEQPSQVSLPQDVGAGTFISSDITVQLRAQFSTMPPDSGIWMLVVFGGMDAHYIFNRKDPSRHALTALDYTVGDKLGDLTHPLIKSSRGIAIG